MSLFVLRSDFKHNPWFQPREIICLVAFDCVYVYSGLYLEM